MFNSLREARRCLLGKLRSSLKSFGRKSPNGECPCGVSKLPRQPDEEMREKI